MYPLKLSTAITVPFFAHDVNGDGVTGLTDGGFTKRISKNGAAFAAMTVTITEMENGWYSFPLSTLHSDTAGILSISFSHASAKRANLQFRVHARIADDLAFPNVSGRGIDVDATGGAEITVNQAVNVAQWNGTTVALPTVAGVPEVDVTHWIGTLVATPTTAGVPEVDVTFANGVVIQAASGRFEVDTELIAGAAPAGAIANAVWNEDATAHQTLGTFGQAIGDPVADTNTIYKATVTDATGATVGVDVVSVQADTDNIQTRIPTALVSGRMDASVGAMAAGVVTAAAVATGAIDADALAADAVDEIWAKAMTEIAAVPGVTASVLDAVRWIFLLSRNKITQTSSVQTLRNDADAANVATAAVSDDGVTAIRSKFV